MIKFILNNKEVATDLPPGMLLLDYVRYHKNLTGTKIGCREGDCGACTVLAGELKNDTVNYRSYTSCLTPIGNVQGKHVVTIEGINLSGLNFIQQAMQDESGTQCGFCTPGFVVSLAGFCLSAKTPNQQNVIAAIDGNICRCTGYKSIERAAAKVAGLLQQQDVEDRLAFVLNHNVLPSYFATIKARLQQLSLETNNVNGQKSETNFVGGGTDLYVQKHDEMKEAEIDFMFERNELNGIIIEGNKCFIGPSATVTDLSESIVFQRCFPGFSKQVKLVSSTPIRNMATIAGNFVNASPIGDFTIFFLALNTNLLLSDGINRREMPLRKFYKGYKILDKKPGEYVEKIWFELPAKNWLFNFEKVSKRTHLDIASVNTAIVISTNNGRIAEANLSAGGLGPVPMFLEKASSYLTGKYLSEDLINDTIEVAQTEVSPISDARGTAEYKRLLLGQLIRAHFITLFPELSIEKLLTVVHP